MVAAFNVQKWVIALISGLLFMLISSPYFYRLTNMFTSRFGLTIASNTGCPNLAGLVIHTVVFILIVRAIMR